MQFPGSNIYDVGGYPPPPLEPPQGENKDPDEEKCGGSNGSSWSTTLKTLTIGVFIVIFLIAALALTTGMFLNREEGSPLFALPGVSALSKLLSNRGSASLTESADAVSANDSYALTATEGQIWNDPSEFQAQKEAARVQEARERSVQSHRPLRDALKSRLAPTSVSRIARDRELAKLRRNNDERHKRSRKLHPLIQARNKKVAEARLQERRKLEALENNQDFDMTKHLPYEQLEVFDVPADGDCFFYCVQHALQGIGKRKTIAELREIVANSVTHEEFETLFQIYSGAAAGSPDYQILNDYAFMRNVSTLDEMRDAMKTRVYFGDEMAVRALENSFGVNWVILLKRGDTSGQNRVHLSKRFNNPDKERSTKYAILLLREDTVHYKLVKLNGKSVIDEEELPPIIRDGLFDNKRKRS